MKYIKFFESINDRITFINSEDYVEPHISFTKEDGGIKIGNHILKLNDQNKYEIYDYEPEDLIEYNITPNDSLDDDIVSIIFNNGALDISCARRAARYISCLIEDDTNIIITQDEDFNHIITYDIYGEITDISITIIANNDININMNSASINCLTYDELLMTPIININNGDYNTNFNIYGCSTLSSNNSSYSIYCSGDLNINGIGKLIINNNKFGIRAKNLLLSSASLDIATYDEDNAISLYIIEDICINGGKLYINNTYNNSIGILCDDMIINNGEVNINSKGECVISNNLYINGGMTNMTSSMNTTIVSNNNVYILGGEITCCGGDNSESIICEYLECDNGIILYTTNEGAILPYTKYGQSFIIGTQLGSNQSICLYTANEDNSDQNTLIHRFKTPINYMATNKYSIISHPVIYPLTYYFININNIRKYKVYSNELRIK